MAAEREKLGKKDIAIIRLEQLAPFPFFSLVQELKNYPNAEFTWCQEEHKNQGPWSFVEPRFRNTLKHIGMKNTEISYAGRQISASSATGYGKTHREELSSFLAEAMAWREESFWNNI